MTVPANCIHICILPFVCEAQVLLLSSIRPSSIALIHCSLLVLVISSSLCTHYASGLSASTSLLARLGVPAASYPGRCGSSRMGRSACIRECSRDRAIRSLYVDKLREHVRHSRSRRPVTTFRVWLEDWPLKGQTVPRTQLQHAYSLAPEGLKLAIGSYRILVGS